MGTEVKRGVNPLNEKQFSRLRKSIEWSGREMVTPRKNRIDAITQYVGSHYSDGGMQRPVPINMLKLAVDIYVRQLAARAPRAMVSTLHKHLKPTAANLELAINQIPDEIGLTETLRRIVTEALFSFGIAKVGICGSDTAIGHSCGSMFVDDLTLDDYFCDLSAKRLDRIQYEGNDYWLDYDEVMESDWVRKEARDGLKPDEYTVLGPEGESRAEQISNTSTADTFKDRLWLRDVWLPAEKLLVTYGVKSERIMNIVEWTGPKTGPYLKLGFSHVPGNLLPLPPVATWRDLHELANALFRKLARQADAQKTVLGFPGGNDDSVASFQKSGDGDGIHYTGAPPQKLEAGGVDPKTLAFCLQSRDLYSYFAGNLDSLGGLSAQTQTVGQDKLLSEAAGSQMRDMASKTIDMVRDVFRSLAHYEWTDPVRRRILEKPIPGTAMTIPVEWDSKAKRGELSMFVLDIDVYSLQDDSPGLKLQKLGALMQQYILPLAPLIQQAGGTICADVILRLAAKYADMPELNDIVIFGDQPMEAGGMEKPPMPANTTRTYERVGRPGASREGASAAIQQLLLGGDPGGDSGK